MLLLLVYAVMMIGLTQVADSWIVALAITPLVFALLISLGCLARLPAGFLRVSSLAWPACCCPSMPSTQAPTR